MEAAHDRLGTRRRLGCSPMVGRAPTACRQPEAAHASTNSRPTPAIRSMHAYRQQHKQKKIDHTQNGAKTRTARRSPHAALSGSARDAATRATRGRGRRALAPARLQRSQTAAALQCSRVRGLPDADDTPRHAPDSTRHAQHPACSDPVAQC